MERIKSRAQNASPSVISSFRDCILFHGLGPAQRDALVARAHIQRFRAGQTIFLMGSPGDGMMAVLEGKVRIGLSSAQGKEMLLATLGEGDVFGEIAMLDGRERTADARALTDCVLGILNRRDVLHFLENNPRACLRLIEVLCRRLRLIDERIGEVVMLQLPARLAKTFLRMMETELEAGRIPEQAAIIHASQRELGNLIGAARERVNKCLQKWQRAGIVKIEEGVVKVIDREGLERLADEVV